MRRIKCLRRLSLLLLSLLLHSVLYSQATSTVQSNLTSIEDFAINIENNSLQQEMKIQSLEEQLKNAKASQEALENSVIEISAQAEELLNSQKSLEHRCMNLKVALVVSISLNIIATGITYMVLSNK